MGIFNQKPKFKVIAPTIRKIVVPVETAKPKLEPRNSRRATPSSDNLSVWHTTSSNGKKTVSLSPRASSSPRTRNSLSPFPAGTDEKKRSGRDSGRKRKLVRRSAHRSSPANERIEFDKDSDTDDNDWEITLSARGQRKRARLDGSREADLDRRLTHPALLGTLNGGDELNEADAGKPEIVHAAAVACLALKCVPVLGSSDDDVSVELQYPGSQHRER